MQHRGRWWCQGQLTEQLGVKTSEGGKKMKLHFFYDTPANTRFSFSQWAATMRKPWRFHSLCVCRCEWMLNESISLANEESHESEHLWTHHFNDFQDEAVSVQVGRRDQAEALPGVWGRGGSINLFSHDGAERENRDVTSRTPHTHGCCSKRDKNLQR